MLQGLFCILFLLLPPTADAHGIRIMASLAGGQIEGYVYYPGAGKAADVLVKLSVHDGGEPRQTRTAADGAFRFTVPPAASYYLSADSGDGHLAHYQLAGSIASDAEHEHTEQLASDQIERLVARQLLPIREQLHAMQDQRRWTDVLGAVGYIFGLAGVAFFILGRKGSGG